MPGPFTKVTFLFNHTRNGVGAAASVASNRSAGWSETWYSSLARSDNQLYANINAWRLARSKLLGLYCGIMGYRVSAVLPSGPVYTSRDFTSPSSGLAQDSPEQALIAMYYSSGGLNKREIILRGTPDARIGYGEYAPNIDYDKALKDFITHCASYWFFLGKVHTVAAINMVGIDANAIIGTETPHGITVPTYVQILRTKTPEGRLRGVPKIQVSRLTDTSLACGPGALPARPTTGGKLRPLEGYGLVAIDNSIDALKMFRAGKRDTGRPFFLQRGRRSAKRA